MVTEIKKTGSKVERKFRGPVISVRGFVRNPENKILLVKRAEHNNYCPGEWSLPGGTLSYTQDPDDTMISLIKEKTGLDYKNVKFIYYQNSLPVEEGLLHCLNMYFRGDASGEVKLAEGFSDHVWITPEQAKEYTLAFGGKNAIESYKVNDLSDLERLSLSWDEAGKAGIPVDKETLVKLNAYPGFFKKLNAHMSVYDEVRIRVNATLSRVRKHHQRNSESIITQIESRTKSPHSIMEKMIRKGEPGIPRHYTTFDDMCGARAVTVLMSDIDTVIKHFEDDPFYKIIAIENYIKNPKPDGYRGVHLTLEVPLHHLPDIDFIPKCEVQLRTNLQHAWAIVTHEFTYKREKDMPPDCLEDLRKLSETLATGDRLSEQLKYRCTLPPKA